MPIRPLPDSDRGWLRGLDSRLWEKHTGTMRNHVSGYEWEHVYYTERKGEKLGPDDWKRLVSLVAEYDLPVNLHNAHFCFGLAISFFDHATPPDVPERLLSVSGVHLPDYTYPRDRDGFEIGWKTFAPLATTVRNAELLVFYGMEPVKTKSMYDY